MYERTTYIYIYTYETTQDNPNTVKVIYSIVLVYIRPQHFINQIRFVGFYKFKSA